MGPKLAENHRGSWQPGGIDRRAFKKASASQQPHGDTGSEPDMKKAPPALFG
jgi:hypothetical protein